MEKSELNELNQNENETNKFTTGGTSKVSIPIYTQSNGFYRYNYEKERLEFINNQTKVVAFFREIPLDQWEVLPSHEAYCREITEAANKQREEENKWLPKGIAGFISCIIGFWAAFLSGIDEIIMGIFHLQDWRMHFITYIFIPIFAIIAYVIIYPIVKLFMKK